MAYRNTDVAAMWRVVLYQDFSNGMITSYSPPYTTKGAATQWLNRNARAGDGWVIETCPLLWQHFDGGTYGR